MKVPEYNEDYFRKIPEMWITKLVGFLEVIESGLLCFRGVKEAQIEEVIGVIGDTAECQPTPSPELSSA